MMVFVANNIQLLKELQVCLKGPGIEAHCGEAGVVHRESGDIIV